MRRDASVTSNDTNHTDGDVLGRRRVLVRCSLNLVPLGVHHQQLSLAAQPAGHLVDSIRSGGDGTKPGRRSEATKSRPRGKISRLPFTKKAMPLPRRGVGLIPPLWTPLFCEQRVKVKMPGSGLFQPHTQSTRKAQHQSVHTSPSTSVSTEGGHGTVVVMHNNTNDGTL